MKATLLNLRFGCPACDQTIEADPDMGGTKGKCPHCKARIVIPRRCDDCGQMIAAGKKCMGCAALAAQSSGPRISKRALVILLVLGGGLWGLYEYEHDRSEREGIRLRDEAKRKMNDYRLRQQAAGRSESPVSVRIVNE